jgi:hypothetical protein
VPRRRRRKRTVQARRKRRRRGGYGRLRKKGRGRVRRQPRDAFCFSECKKKSASYGRQSTLRGQIHKHELGYDDRESRKIVRAVGRARNGGEEGSTRGESWGEKKAVESCQEEHELDEISWVDRDLWGNTRGAREV